MLWYILFTYILVKYVPYDHKYYTTILVFDFKMKFLFDITYVQVEKLPQFNSKLKPRLLKLNLELSRGAISWN